MIITLTGTNSYLRQRELRRLVNEFVKANGDFALEKIDGEETEFLRINDAIQSLPMLANKKMVLVTSPGANKQFVEQIEEVIAKVPESTDLVIVEPKLDKRLSYYKTLKTQTDFKEYNELDETGLTQWLTEYVKSEGGSISSGDAKYLVERVGANQQLLSGEIDKILTYDSDISRSTIEKLTEPTPQSTIFELIDAAFAGNHKRTLKLYKEQRQMKVEPQQIIAMIAWQLNALAIVVSAGDRQANVIAKDAKMNPFVVRKTQTLAKKIGPRTLRKLAKDALELDESIKTENIVADDALIHYLISINVS